MTCIDPGDPTDEIFAWTFEKFGAVSEADKPSPPPVGYEDQNLVAINCAIVWSARTKCPVYGLAGTYVIGDGVDDRIKMLADAQVICAPGCVIRWDFNTSFALVGGPSDASNAKWRGATFTPIPTLGVLPTGDIFRMSGSAITIEDTLINAFATGTAIRLAGNGHTIDRTRVVSGTGVGSAGFRLSDGIGLRVRDCDVNTHGDTLRLTPSATMTGTVADLLVFGFIAKSTTGKLVSFEGDGAGIEGVVFDGFNGDATAATAISIQNTAGPVTEIAFRDATVTTTCLTAEAVLIVNNVASVPFGNIDLDGLVVTRTGTAVGSLPPVVRVNGTTASLGVFGFRWSRGLCSAEDSGSLLSMDKVTDALIDGTAFNNGTAASTIVIGASETCRNVVFSDAGLSNAKASGYGVEFRKAIASGWVRGAIGGTATSASPAFVSVKFAADAQACYVEDADLTNNAKAEDAKIEAVAGATYRLTGNYGSTQRTPLQLGAPVQATMAVVGTPRGRIDAPVGSYVAVSTSGSGSTSATSLARIVGGNIGDVVVVTKSSASPSTVTVVESTAGTDNLRLSPSAPYALASVNDTVTLLCTGGTWIELAHSING